jgi:EmrB/QacA subfamily drug resistance transporter
MIALDFSIVTVALPSMRNDLGFTQDTLQWVISAYALTFGGFLIFGGRLADLYGRRALLVGGLLLLVVSSLIAGLSSTAAMLVILRGVQGLAAAAIAPAALSLLTTTFPDGPARQRALAAWGSVLGAGFVSGVLLGGVLTEFAGWRWVLLGNVPVAAAAAILAPMVLPSIRAKVAGRDRLDVPGAVLITGGVIAIVYALSEGNVVGWVTVRTLGVLAGAVVLIALFLLVEARAQQPLVPLGVFRLRPVSVANATNVLVIGAFVGVMYILTLFLQGVHGFTPLETGLCLALAGVAGFAGGVVAGKLPGRIGVREALVLGALAQAAATMLLFMLPANNTVVLVAFGTIVLNFADVIAIVMINIGAVTGVPADSQGAAGGLLNASQQVGSGLGLAVISSIVAAVIAGRTPGNAQPSVSSVIYGYRWGLVIAAVFAILGAAIAGFGLRQQRPVTARAKRPGVSMEAQSATG